MTVASTFALTGIARLDADLSEALHRRLRKELEETRRLVAFLDAAIERNIGGK